MSFVKLILLVVVVGAPASAAAHGERVPFVEWGAYEPATARCQRVVLDATVRCARTAWRVRSRCLAAEASGNSCDRAATNARVVAVRRRALDAIDHVCSVRQLGDLGFLGQFDLQGDVIAGCREWDVLMRTAVYEPPIAGDPACLAAFDRIATRSAVRVAAGWTRLMRRLAARSFPAEEMERLAERERQREQRARDRAVIAVRAACGAEDRFEARVGRIVDMAVCPLAQVCVQEGVLCPEPVCGNGIVEPGELCDAGVPAGEDACRSGCG